MLARQRRDSVWENVLPSFRVRYHCLAMLICIAVSLTLPARADSLDLQIVDSRGEPLENAVVLLPGQISTPPSSVAVMDQVNLTFVPHVLVIQRGQQVVFPNSDNIRHHVYSFSPAKAFEIKLYAGTPEAPIAFDTAGIVVLGCNIHDNMVGYIVVADTPLTGVSNGDGRIRLTVDDLPPTIRIWHPLLVTQYPAPVTLPLPVADSTGQRTLTLNVQQPTATPAAATFGNRFKKHHDQ